MWFPALAHHHPPRERDAPAPSQTCIYIPVRAYIYVCVSLCVPAYTPPPARTQPPASSPRPSKFEPRWANLSRFGYNSPSRAVPATAERPFPSSLLLPRAANAFFFCCSLPSLSLSVRLSPSWPPASHPRSPPYNLPFLLQILNTCCPTALSRRDMCSLLPGSFACALAEVCICPGPAADPLPSPPSSPHRALSPFPVPCRCVCRVPARPRGTAAGTPAPLCHPAASSTVYMHRHGTAPARAYIGIVSENPPLSEGPALASYSRAGCGG